jgi:hypothetical protein
MTEQQWRTCGQPMAMLNFLRGKASDRKLRLFAVTCCCRVWYLLPVRLRPALPVAERYADGLATEGDLAEARERLPVAPPVAIGAPITRQRLLWEAVWYTLSQPVDSVRVVEAVMGAALREDENWALCGWLRHLVGNPFRPKVIPDSWVLGNGGTVGNLAQAIYAEDQFDALPILADALEEAGCQDDEVLAHCRRRGEHRRGCWLLDQLLGKW